MPPFFCGNCHRASDVGMTCVECSAHCCSVCKALQALIVENDFYKLCSFEDTYKLPKRFRRFEEWMDKVWSCDGVAFFHEDRAICDKCLLNDWYEGGFGSTD